MESRVRILLIDDNAMDRKLVRDVLEIEKGRFVITHADNYDKLNRLLAEGRFDIALSEINMPGFEGLGVIPLVKERDPDLPVVIITRKGSEDIVIQAFKAGAADYIIKSASHMQGLASAITSVLEHKRMVEECKRSVETLRHSEIRYRRLHESLRDGFAFTDMDGNIMDFNESFRQMLGYAKEELKRLNFIDITPAKWHDFEKKIIKEQVLLKGFSKVYEKEYQRRDGSTFPVELRVFIYKNEFGENEGMWAIARDITDRKRTELSLKESEANFRDLFDYSPVGKSMTEIDGTLRVNRAFCRLLGYSKRELQHKHWEDITFPEDIPESKAIAQSLLKGKKTMARYEKRYIHKNGSIVWADISTYLRRDHENIPKFFITTITDITERKRAEEELIFRNILLTTQHEVSIDGILVVDEKDSIISYNHRFVELMNIPQRLIDKGSDKQVLHFVTERMADAPQFLQRVQYLYEHRREVSREEIALKDGRILDRYSSPMFGSGDHYYGRVWYFRDITEQKHTEEALKQSEAFNKAIMDNLPLGIAVNSVEPDVKFEYMNDLFPKIYRTTREALSNPDAFWDSVYEDPVFREEIRNRILNDYNSGDPDRMHWEDVPITRKDGETFFISASNTFVPGKPIMISTVWDVTERKQIEEKLRQSDARFRSFFELSIAGFAITSKTTSWIEVNDYLCKLLGYSREELLQSTWADLTHPEDMDLDLDHFNRIMKGEIDGYTIDKRFIRKDGEIIWTSLSVKSVRLTGGQVDYLLAMLVDISEHKLAEDKINKLNEELEQRVVERTNQLQMANKELEAFSYSVSHDLRAPLRALDGFARILLEEYSGKIDDEGRRLLNVITDNSKRMGNLIDDLLEFSRLNRQEVKLSKIDMKTMVNSVCGELVLHADKVNINFNLKKLPKAFGDPAMVRQVWVNLIGNAIKFSSRKQKQIIEIGYQPDGLENIYYVKDNGAGFDMTHSGKLFGVFQRLHSMKDFKGTGVGLAIVQRIVLRLNGRVWGEGKVNEGATFYFSLPNQYILENGITQQ